MNLAELRRVLSANRVLNKTSSNPEELKICCPTCSDTKFRMQVNPTLIRHQIQGWCYCYKGSHSLTLHNLFKFFRIDVDLTSPEVSPQTSFETFAQKMQALKDKYQEILPVPKPQLPESVHFIPIIPATSWRAKQCLAYLQGRGFTEDQIKRYNLMWTGGELANRVIIPFEENGELVYYQARSINKHTEPKISNPTESQCGTGKTQVLFNMDQAQLYQEVYITEGWASAMSAGLNAVALNGKSASVRQVELLKTYWNSYLVMLDPGAESEAFELACRLKTQHNSVRIASLIDGDPNECSKEHLKATISEAYMLNSVSDAKLDRIKWSTSC